MGALVLELKMKSTPKFWSIIAGVRGLQSWKLWHIQVNLVIFSIIYYILHFIYYILVYT